jgi:hypothetical protein
MGYARHAFRRRGDGLGALEDYTPEEPAAGIGGKVVPMIEIAAPEAAHVVSPLIGDAREVVGVVFDQGLFYYAKDRVTGGPESKVPILEGGEGGIQ